MTTIRRPTASDIETIVTMREEASAWLASRGIDQWQNAWPTKDAQSLRREPRSPQWRCCAISSKVIPAAASCMTAGGLRWAPPPPSSR